MKPERKPVRKENSWQGYHGYGREDDHSYGANSNYSNFKDKNSKLKKFKKPALIACGGILLLWIGSLIAGSLGGGNSISQAQLDYRDIIKSNTVITSFIDEYGKQNKLRSSSARYLTAQVKAVSISNGLELNSNYREVYKVGYSGGTIPKASVTAMENAAINGTTDKEYIDQLEQLVSNHRTNIEALYKTTANQPTKDLLEEVYASLDEDMLALLMS